VWSYPISHFVSFPSHRVLGMVFELMWGGMYIPGAVGVEAEAG
jgi:hypothetical protein